MISTYTNWRSVTTGTCSPPNISWHSGNWSSMLMAALPITNKALSEAHGQPGDIRQTVLSIKPWPWLQWNIVSGFINGSELYFLVIQVEFTDHLRRSPCKTGITVGVQDWDFIPELLWSDSISAWAGKEPGSFLTLDMFFDLNILIKGMNFYTPLYDPV